MIYERLKKVGNYLVRESWEYTDKLKKKKSAYEEYLDRKMEEIKW